MAFIQGQTRWSLAGLAFALLVAVTTENARSEGPEAKDLHRGLIAVCKGTGRDQVIEVAQLEPTIALALKDNEAPHPRLPADALTISWKGHLNILRNGSYRFAVQLRGAFHLKIANKEVLKARSDAKVPGLIEGVEVQLEAGVHPIVAEFEKLAGGVARIELLWQGPDFRREPLPYHLVGHLAAATPKPLASDEQMEQGRFLFEEASCARCHRPDDQDRLTSGLQSRQAPDLSKIGERAHAGWIARWLESPQKMRSGAAMPEMFGHDEAGRTERYAVAHYLAGLGGPVKASTKKPKPQDLIASVLRGRQIFNSVGCVACHNPEGTTIEPGTFFGPRRNFPLKEMGGKTTPEKLAEYLKNPLAVDPSGRMPHLLLDDKEALDVARFLCQSEEDNIKKDLGSAPVRGQMFAAFKRIEPRPEEFTPFEKLTLAAAWTDLGKRLVIAKGCNNCHTIEPDGKPFAQVQANADLSDLKKLNEPNTGCLADKPDTKAKSPRYDFTAGDRAALRAFLKTGLIGAGSPAPAHAARTDLRRYNCLACHGRDGEGGLTAEMVELLRKYEKTENAEAISPPPLTGVAHKLRTPWLRGVLTGAGRARPWMALRMPQFGEAQVGKLPEALAALEGTDTDETIHKLPLVGKQIDAGRLLVGKTAFGCISCHDIAGNVTGGTRGPDLALMNQRRALRLVSPLAGAGAADAAGDADAGDIHCGQVALRQRLRRQRGAASGGHLGVPVAGADAAVADRPRSAEGAGAAAGGTTDPAADVHAGRWDEGHRGRFSGRRFHDVRCGDLPIGLRLVRRLPRRQAGVGRPRRQPGEGDRPAFLDRRSRLPDWVDVVRRAARLRHAGQRSLLRRENAGGRGLQGRTTVAIHRLQHRQGRQPDLPLHPGNGETAGHRDGTRPAVALDGGRWGLAELHDRGASGDGRVAEPRRGQA